MRICQGIYSPGGGFFLTRGTVLNHSYIHRLRKLSIDSIYVSTLSQTRLQNPPEDVITEKTRIQAIKKVQTSFKNFQMAPSIDIDELKQTAKTIIADLTHNQRNLLQINDIRLHDDYTFSHSVNVAVIATMLGRLCHYNNERLHDLTLSALLHDVGKIKIPLPILNKPINLSEAELETIQRHPDYGYNILINAKQFCALAAQVAQQHHEKLDGSGYPQQLSGNAINQEARIVAIADVYDALTSDRPYKKAYRPDIAYKIMSNCSPGHFDPDLLRIFFNNVAIYPIGTIVKTVLGFAIVTSIVNNHTLTPKIAVFADNNQTPLDKPLFIDLKSYTKGKEFIENVLEDSELIAVYKKLKFEPLTLVDKAKG